MTSNHFPDRQLNTLTFALDFHSFLNTQLSGNW